MHLLFAEKKSGKQWSWFSSPIFQVQSTFWYLLITIVLSRRFESTNGLSWLRSCSVFVIYLFLFLPTGIRSSAIFNLEAIDSFKVQDFTASRFCCSRTSVMLPRITLFVTIISFHSTAFRKTDLRNHSFPKIYCILGSILRAFGSQEFLIVRYILHCIALWVIAMNWHGIGHSEVHQGTGASFII